MRVTDCLDLHQVPKNYRLHLCASDRSWLRDTAPTAVFSENQTQWTCWSFNAWSKYDNYSRDAQVAPFVATQSGLPYPSALRPDNAQPLVLEGGAIETDGLGTLLVTEECLLSPIQCRNPGLTRAGYEAAFERILGH